MAKLTTKKRNSLKSTTFGEPKQRKYPMPDKAHAINAKARATQMVKKGKLSKSAESKIDAKANKIIGKKRGRPMKAKEGSAYEEKHESKGEKKVEAKAGMAYKKLQEKHDKLKEKHHEMKSKYKEDMLLLKQKHKAKLLAK